MYVFHTTVTLKNVGYGNNAVLSLPEIGEGPNALILHTDSTDCCRGPDNPTGGTPLGTCYYPDGSQVLSSGEGGSIYMVRGARMVQLNHKHNIQSPTGVYRCEVITAAGNSSTVSVELGFRKSPIRLMLLFI